MKSSRNYIPGISARPVSSRPSIKQNVILPSGARYQVLSSPLRDETPISGRAASPKLQAVR